MEWLLEIVSSDGTVIDAENDAEVVTAALDEWGFLATAMDDMEDVSEEAMEVLVDQLDSTSSAVQVAAGEDIALLYEKSWTEVEEDERAHDFDEEDLADPSNEIPRDARGRPTYVKRYEVFRQKHLLLKKIEDVMSQSTKRTSKKDKHLLSSNFRAIHDHIELPIRGPKRRVIGIGSKATLHIKTYEQMLRFNALRRVLQSGFLVHYTDNEVVFETIPLMLRDTGRHNDTKPKGAKRGGARAARDLGMASLDGALSDD